LRISRRIKKLPLPALALVIAILGTASLLLITTLRSLARDQERIVWEMRNHGTAVVRTLESGARTGMMMRWGTEQLQTLVEEAALLPEIAYVTLFDGAGEIVAESSVGAASPPWRSTAELRRLVQEGRPVFTNRNIDGKGVFQVARKFAPHSHRRMMGRRMRRPLPEKGEEWAIVLGLYTGTWEKVLDEGRRQSFLSFLVILIAGSIALYLGILLQNNFVVRRTLNETRAYAQNIIENMADGLLSVDDRGKIAAFNPEAARILDRREPDLRGALFASIIPAAGEALSRTLEGEARSEEMEVLLDAGEGEDRPTGIACSPLRDEEGRISGAVVLLRDLSEVRRLQEKMRQAEKLAAVGEMAATVAHEIRNPLSSLKGFAQLFREKFDPGSDEAGYASLMVREVDRLNRTITDLLFFSRPLEISRRKVVIDKVLQETLRLLQRDFEGKSQQVTWSGEEGISLGADPDQIARVFLNILLNAHQAAGEAGEIAVRIATVEEGGWCRISFTDSGPGMAAEEISRAFDPFYTTREKGSGLGLAIVRKIVELHDGRVSIDSLPDRGTTVVVDLPAAGREEG
jgi:two-component system sensor histidine kinase HydH